MARNKVTDVCLYKTGKDDEMTVWRPDANEHDLNLVDGLKTGDCNRPLKIVAHQGWMDDEWERPEDNVPVPAPRAGEVWRCDVVEYGPNFLVAMPQTLYQPAYKYH